MKKIKILFAVLTAITGIGGAYATTLERSANRVGTIYNWHTIGGTIVFTTTVPDAALRGMCNSGSCFCMRGTAITPTSIPIVTLFHECR